MKLKVIHRTRYAYDQPVFVEPHHLYFIPQHRVYLDLLKFDLKVNPDPSGLSRRLDAEGNQYYQCWFNELIDHLTIDVEMEVETRPFNAFDFLIEEESENQVLDIYRKLSVELDHSLTNWIEQFDPDGNPGIGFLSDACNAMYDRWEHTMNDSQELCDPNSSFKEPSASCRDLAWMMMCMLRHVGVPARFVSGYGFNPELGGHELHAWVEAWVFGAGWVGLDPSSGLMTTENYVPLATSYHPSNTLPVQGRFRGSGSSDLETSVEIQKLD